MREEGGRNMQSIHEMYQELYKAIREMPLPSSPDDPEYNEKEDYVEPEWYKDGAARFEEAYEEANSWDSLFPTNYSKEAPVILFEDQEDPSTI